MATICINRTDSIALPLLHPFCTRKFLVLWCCSHRFTEKNYCFLSFFAHVTVKNIPDVWSSQSESLFSACVQRPVSRKWQPLNAIVSQSVSFRGLNPSDKQHSLCYGQSIYSSTILRQVSLGIEVLRSSQPWHAARQSESDAGTANEPWLPLKPNSPRVWCSACLPNSVRLCWNQIFVLSPSYPNDQIMSSSQDEKICIRSKHRLLWHCLVFLIFIKRHKNEFKESSRTPALKLQSATIRKINQSTKCCHNKWIFRNGFSICYEIAQCNHEKMNWGDGLKLRHLPTNSITGSFLRHWKFGCLAARLSWDSKLPQTSLWMAGIFVGIPSYMEALCPSPTNHHLSGLECPQTLLNLQKCSHIHLPLVCCIVQGCIEIIISNQ